MIADTDFVDTDFIESQYDDPPFKHSNAIDSDSDVNQPDYDYDNLYNNKNI
jgi:hypothetical protein